jgi:hypothetical protein
MLATIFWDTPFCGTPPLYFFFGLPAGLRLDHPRDLVR